MKSLLFSLIFISCSIVAFAQKPAVPVDEKGMVVYTDVVTVEGATDAVLYDRLNKWFTSYYKNPSSVITENNEGKGITGRHNIDIHKMVGTVKHQSGRVRYTINVDVRDGRYRYEISDIFLVQSPRLLVHAWLDENHKDAELHFNYLTQVHEFLSALETNLKTAMSTGPKEKKSDW